MCLELRIESNVVRALPAYHQRTGQHDREQQDRGMVYWHECI